MRVRERFKEQNIDTAKLSIEYFLFFLKISLSTSHI